MGRQGEVRTDRVWPGFCLLVSLSPHLLVWTRVSRPTLELFLKRTTGLVGA